MRMLPFGISILAQTANWTVTCQLHQLRVVTFALDFCIRESLEDQPTRYDTKVFEFCNDQLCSVLRDAPDYHMLLLAGDQPVPLSVSRASRAALVAAALMPANLSVPRVRFVSAALALAILLMSPARLVA